MRNLSSEALALLASDRMIIGYFYEGVFNSTTLRLWTGDRNLDIDGNTFLGNGWFVNPGPWKETSQNQSYGQNVTLTGVPLELVALMLNGVSQSNTGRVGLLLFNDDLELLATIDTFSGDLDQVSFDEGATTSTLSLSYESKGVRMNETRDFRLSDATHRATYPDDKGFEYLSQIASTRIYWGRPDTSRDR